MILAAKATIDLFVGHRRTLCSEVLRRDWWMQRDLVVQNEKLSVIVRDRPRGLTLPYTKSRKRLLIVALVWQLDYLPTRSGLPDSLKLGAVHWIIALVISVVGW